MWTTRLWNNLLQSKSKDRKDKKLKSFGIGNTDPKQNNQNRLNEAREKIPVFPLEFVEKNRISVQIIQDKDMTLTELLQKMATTS